MIAQKGFYFNSFSFTTYVTVMKAKILCRMVNKCCLSDLKKKKKTFLGQALECQCRSKMDLNFLEAQS